MLLSPSRIELIHEGRVVTKKELNKPVSDVSLLQRHLTFHFVAIPPKWCGVCSYYKRRDSFFSPQGTFIKGIAEYDYFWKDDTTAGLENVDNFDFQELTDEDEKTLKYCFVEWNCYCRHSAKEWGWRALRVWQRILG